MAVITFCSTRRPHEKSSYKASPIKFLLEKVDWKSYCFAPIANKQFFDVFDL